MCDSTLRVLAQEVVRRRERGTAIGMLPWVGFWKVRSNTAFLCYLGNVETILGCCGWLVFSFAGVSSPSLPVSFPPHSLGSLHTSITFDVYQFG